MKKEIDRLKAERDAERLSVNELSLHSQELEARLNTLMERLEEMAKRYDVPEPPRGSGLLVTGNLIAQELRALCVEGGGEDEKR